MATKKVKGVRGKEILADLKVREMSAHASRPMSKEAKDAWYPKKSAKASDPPLDAGSLTAKSTGKVASAKKAAAGMPKEGAIHLKPQGVNRTSMSIHEASRKQIAGSMAGAGRKVATHTLQRGKKGGTFYIANGKKVYAKK